MNKKLVGLISTFCLLAILFAACNDDDDYVIDEVWKAYQENIVKETSANSAYRSLESQSKNGSVYWKRITDFIPDEGGEFGESPLFTDSVDVRYEGWYYNYDMVKKTFDSTEGDNNARVVRFGLAGGVIDGFSTIFQDMQVGEQREVCIPYQLAYGSSGLSSSGYQIIPGYTTLWYRVKLMAIKHP